MTTVAGKIDSAVHAQIFNAEVSAIADLSMEARRTRIIELEQAILELRIKVSAISLSLVKDEENLSAAERKEAAEKNREAITRYKVSSAVADLREKASKGTDSAKEKASRLEKLMRKHGIDSKKAALLESFVSFCGSEEKAITAMRASKLL